MAFTRTDDARDLMKDAIFDALPIAADISADNTAENLRDGSISTVFQPIASDSFKFRFHLEELAAPDALELHMDSRNVESVRVRIGESFASLHDVFAGPLSGTRITLNGERVRAFEIVFTMRQGVPRIGEMKLLQPRTTVRFRAEPGQRYALLYGGPERVSNPIDVPPANAEEPVAATLGRARNATAAERADHDGIDAGDNCPDRWNADQRDRDGDVVGDACDNCPNHPNSTQEDANNNGIGDVCEDPDRDGIVNVDDNCPDVRNGAQQDGDRDGIGNACDDVDDRLNTPGSWGMWAGMTAVILLLAGVGYRVLRRNG